MEQVKHYIISTSCSQTMRSKEKTEINIGKDAFSYSCFFTNRDWRVKGIRIELKVGEKKKNMRAGMISTRNGQKTQFLTNINI